MTNVSFFPDKSLSDANNFCRNPDRKYGIGPWCITNDLHVLWEPCGVSLCQGIRCSICLCCYQVELSFPPFYQVS